MWQRFRKWLNIDHIVDLAVDLFLILFDVLSSPILIVMRLLRWTVGKFMLDGLKGKIKRLIHWTTGKHPLSANLDLDHDSMYGWNDPCIDVDLWTSVRRTCNRSMG